MTQHVAAQGNFAGQGSRPSRIASTLPHEES
jgi:hypothetical protein